MAREDGSARGSGRTVLAVLLAVVFLAVIGGSAGVILGMREVRANRFPNTPNLPSTGAPRPTDDNPAQFRKACPEPTVRAVVAKGGNGTLEVRRYLETELSQVWVCAGSDGQIWYQGHRKAAPDRRYPAADLIEGDNGLLLPATAMPEDRYEAANGGTRYTVSPERLTITSPDGSEEVQAAIDTFP